MSSNNQGPAPADASSESGAGPPAAASTAPASTVPASTVPAPASDAPAPPSPVSADAPADAASEAGTGAGPSVPSGPSGAGPKHVNAPAQARDNPVDTSARPAYGMDYQKKMAAMATQVIIKANKNNDYGFDISPDTRYSPYRGKDCAKDLKSDLEKLQCAKKKYISKIGMKMHQRARQNKYRGLITDICKRDKQLACSKYALPVHDICNCDMKSMKLSEVVPYAMSFYRGLQELVESQTMSKDDYREMARKASEKLEKVSDAMNKGREKISKGVKNLKKEYKNYKTKKLEKSIQKKLNPGDPDKKFTKKLGNAVGTAGKVVGKGLGAVGLGAVAAATMPVGLTLGALGSGANKLGLMGEAPGKILGDTGGLFKDVGKTSLGAAKKLLGRGPKQPTEAQQQGYVYTGTGGN